MSNAIAGRAFLFVVLIIFVAFKIPHLQYPYYWDESWPYAVAIKDMYHHGISLMPDAIDAELSRGHPLFFHAAAATWMHLFGDSPVAMHSFALFISVLFLVAIYEVGFRLFNRRVATIALLLVATQVIFIIQSSFVLFEVLVAMLAFLSLYYYTRDRYLPTVLCLTALFLTKESGMIAGFVLGIDAIAGLFNTSRDLKTRLYRIASVAAPCLFIGAYFLLQQHLRGWYIFPLHHDLIENNWKRYWYTLRVSVLDNTFDKDLKNWYFVALMALSVVVAWMNGKAKFGMIAVMGIIIYIMVDDMRPGRIMPGIPFFIVFVISVLLLLKVYSGLWLFPYVRHRRFIRLSGLFVFCFLCFCPLNFFIYRYALAALIPALFLSAVFFDALLSHSSDKIYYPLLTFILLLGVVAYKSNTGYGDCDPGAFNGIALQQDVVNYLVSNSSYDTPIAAGSFLQRQQLTDTATGYLHSARPFENVRWDIDSTTRYLVFDNIESDSRYNDVKNDGSFHMVHRYTRGPLWAEIYARK